MYGFRSGLVLFLGFTIGWILEEIFFDTDYKTEKYFDQLKILYVK